MEDYYSHRHSSGRFSHDGVDDSGTEQYIDASGLDGEQFTKLMRIQHHGLTSTPPADAHYLGVSPGGARDRLYLIGGESPSARPKNTPSGATCLYDDKGNIIRMYTDNGIQIEAKNGDVYVKPAPGKFIYLGGDGTDGAYDFIVTVSGPSTIAKAKK